MTIRNLGKSSIKYPLGTGLAVCEGILGEKPHAHCIPISIYNSYSLRAYPQATGPARSEHFHVYFLWLAGAVWYSPIRKKPWHVSQQKIIEFQHFYQSAIRRNFKEICRMQNSVSAALCKHKGPEYEDQSEIWHRVLQPDVKARRISQKRIWTRCSCGTKKELYCCGKKKRQDVLLVCQSLEGSSVCPRQSALRNGFGETSFSTMFDDISPSNSGRASGFGESFKILFRYVFSES